MKQKTYFVVLSALIFVLNFIAFMSLTLNKSAVLRYWFGNAIDFRADILYIAILLSMVALAIMLTLSIYFFIFNDKIVVLHCNMIISILVLAFFQITLLCPPYFQNNSLSMIFQLVCGIVIGAFYLIGLFALRKAEATRNLFHLIYVTVFSVVLVFSDLINVNIGDRGYFYNSFSMANMSWVTLVTFIVGIGYYLLYCMGKGSKLYAILAISIDGVLTILLIFLKFFGACPESRSIYLLVGVLLAYLILLSFVFCLLLKNKGKGIGGKRKTKILFKELETLHMLHEAGILTDEEYQAQKDKIFGGK